MQQLAALNAQVTQQAAMVAYDDNFKLMMWLALAAIPAVLLLRRATPARTQLVSAESTIVE